MTASLPVLLPSTAIPSSSSSYSEWTPKRYLSGPQPPPNDDAKTQELEMAAARQMMDGKVVKKTRPRRTVDFNGSLGRWTLVSFVKLYIFGTEIYGLAAKIKTQLDVCPLHATKSTLHY